jgi:hypothetical protein
MMFFVLTEVWIITNYPVFRAALQIPLSWAKKPARSKKKEENS